MAKITLEFHQLGSLIEGLIGFPWRLERIDVQQVKYAVEDQGFVTEGRIRMDSTQFKLVDLGARKFNVVKVDDQQWKVTETGTHKYLLTRYTDTQVYQTPSDRVIDL